jgi:hypothetical protein
LVKKELGPDKLLFSTKWLLWRWDKLKIVRMTRADIRKGTYTVVWKGCITVVVRKPGKNDYTKLTPYRSISLLTCVGKVVDILAAELLSEKAERRGLVSDGQFGS